MTCAICKRASMFVCLSVRVLGWRIHQRMRKHCAGCSLIVILRAGPLIHTVNVNRKTKCRHHWMRNVQQRNREGNFKLALKKKHTQLLKYLIPWVSFYTVLCHVVCVEFERFCIYYWVNGFYSQNKEIELQKARLILFLKIEEDMLLLLYKCT